MTRKQAEDVNSRHIAVDLQDPHCVKSRQCYGSKGAEGKKVCNKKIHKDPSKMNITNGNEVCGAFWRGRLLFTVYA